MGTASKARRLPPWSGRLVLTVLITAGLVAAGLAPAQATAHRGPAARAAAGHSAAAAHPAPAAPVLHANRGTGALRAPKLRAAAVTSTVVNAGGNLCMDDPNSQTTTGVQLIQWTCNGGTNQNWTFTLVSGTTNTYTIASFAGLCVDISGRSTADNAQVIQWTCNSQPNQQFQAVPVAVSGKTSTFNLVAVHSGKCIVPTGDSTASNTLLVQLPCSAAATRVWQVSALAGGGGGGGFQGLPGVAPNSCHSTTCPRRTAPTSRFRPTRTARGSPTRPRWAGTATSGR